MFDVVAQMTLRTKFLSLCVLWIACGGACCLVVAAHPNAISSHEAHLQPGIGILLAGVLFFGLGAINALLIVSSTAQRTFAILTASAGAIMLIQGFRGYAEFGDTIAFRSPLSFAHVSKDYTDAVLIEVQWEHHRGRPRRLYQVVLHFRGGTRWRSAIDGMVEDENDVRSLLQVIRTRAPNAPIRER